MLRYPALLRARNPGPRLIYLTSIKPSSALVSPGANPPHAMFARLILRVNIFPVLVFIAEKNSQERILTAEEAKRLLESASVAIRPVLVIALNTGMRRTEILSLKWSNVDLVRNYISIVESKSGRSRKIPMNGAGVEAFLQLPHQAEFVFFNPETGNHILDVKTAFHAACRRAKKDPQDEEDPGIVGLRFHDLRHTAASKMIEAGVDLVTVSKILGHASIQMTMRYAHPTPENMRQAVEKLGNFLGESRMKSNAVEIIKLRHIQKSFNL